MAHSGEELEIKLKGAAADVAALSRSRLFAALADGAFSWERLISTYYDTPDEALAKAGASLRVREEAGGLVQTAKRRNGSFARHEDEQTLASADAFPATPQDEKLAEIINGANGLAPVARTVTDRWAVVIEKRKTRIEAAFDLGRAEVFENGEPSRAAPLAEAELELLEGEPGALFKIARLCLGESEGRLRLSAASKEEQARSLLNGAELKGEPNLSFKKNSSVGDAFAAALMASALRVIEVAPAVAELRLPEGAHQLRVALRRFRVIERIFREAIGTKETRGLARRAKKFGEFVGPARDWDVFIAETLRALKARSAEAAGFAKLEVRADALRAEAWQEASDRVSSLKFNKFALDLLAAAHLQDWRKKERKETDAPAHGFAGEALDKRLEEVRNVAATAMGAGASALHPLRIALKKLRYSAQTFRPLYPRDKRKPYMAAMSRLQDCLGEINDAVVAQELANAAAEGEGRAAARAAGFICGFRAAEAEAATAEIAERWKAFEAMTPFWRDEGEPRS